MKLYEIVFSPTGGTQKVATLLAEGLTDETVRIDLTDGARDFSAVRLTRDDLALIAVPSYVGRVPAPATERLAALHGGGARAVLVCVYGNRAYEDTLTELGDTAAQAGFRVVAAVAAVAEHSVVRQFAAGRPDAQDARQLAAFAAEIRRKLEAEDTSGPSTGTTRRRPTQRAASPACAASPSARVPPGRSARQSSPPSPGCWKRSASGGRRTNVSSDRHGTPVPTGYTWPSAGSGGSPPASRRCDSERPRNRTGASRYGPALRRLPDRADSSALPVLDCAERKPPRRIRSAADSESVCGSF